MASDDGPSEEVVAATFKVLVLGNSNVGKSTIIKLFSAGQHPGSLLPTIGESLLVSLCM